MAAFSPIAGLPVAAAPAGGAAPPTISGAFRAAGEAVARLAMSGTGNTAGKGAAGAVARAAGHAGAPLTWWTSRRQKSYLGR